MRLHHPPPLSGKLIYTPPGRAGSHQTATLMREHVNAGKVNPAIIQLARSVVSFAPPFGTAEEIKALFDYVQNAIRFVNDPLGVETLSFPLTTSEQMAGDCDDKACLLATLLEAIGVPTRFVMAGYGGPYYEHIYLQALMQDQWITLDSAVSQPMGWEAPGAVSLWIEGA